MTINNQVDNFQIEDKAIGSDQLADSSIIDADISNTANIQQSKINNLSTDLAGKLNVSGGVMTGSLFGVDPVDDLDAATKESVDTFANMNGGSASFLLKEPTIYVYDEGSITVTVEPLKFGSGLSTQSFNSAQSDLVAANMEGGLSPTFGSNYYLYFNSGDLVFSSTAPNVFKKHPTNNWYYLCFIKTRSGTNDIAPFVKTGSFYRYLSNVSLLSLDATSAVIPSLTPTTIHFGFNGVTTTYSFSGLYRNLDVSSYVPPKAKIAKLAWSGTYSTASQPSAINIYSDTTNTYLFDWRNVVGYNGAGGGNNQGSSDSSQLFAPIISNNIYIAISASNNTRFGQRVWLEGFFD
jgi:hypothetical protein